jgi:hypothetical protein
MITGDRRANGKSGTQISGTAAGGGAATTTFVKPSDNIGTKTIPDYAGYAGKFIYTITIPGCSSPGKVFVGQRKDPFAVNLGTIFDLVNVPSAAFLLDANNKDAVQIRWPTRTSPRWLSKCRPPAWSAAATR